ncbi:hypothetical protein NUU61_004065 [Penicillium alfredii]|uniref:Uncharacterized protein n=1 Tax=Penicillium alfredii TaxID=1506179 RepID=A0A9W9FKE8_9EURO|nr:uncharacterized protein NUU61_004065 [Penicillium alfredii]KAJ5101843.1 hypothetical protein NUU61_004065 [Penicillium alfredii]
MQANSSNHPLQIKSLKNSVVPLRPGIPPEEAAQYTQRFYQILEDGQPDQAMEVMVDPRSAELVGSLADSVFVEVLHLLSPAHFVEPFRDLHLPLHAWIALRKGVKRIEEIFDDFVGNLLTIVGYRTAAGVPLHLAEYTHLLDCARSMGNAPLADELWEAMVANKVELDAVCYNHIMEAKVWDHAYTGLESKRLQMTSFNWRKRGMENPTRGWRGYGTGARSVRTTVWNIYHQMTEEGHPSDERTFVNLMIASSRVGDIQGVKKILWDMWNVDIDALKEETDNSKLPPATPYDPWSALYPTDRLLFAVAHTLATNNDIPGALRGIDFISSAYNIPIPHKVWYDLFERAYTLSRERRKTSHRGKKGSLANGAISRDLLRVMFDTMTSEPYNVPPTVEMYTKMARTNQSDGRLADCKSMLAGAYEILRQSRKERKEAKSAVVHCLGPALEYNSEEGTPLGLLFAESPHLAEAVQTYDILQLQVFQQTHLINRTVYSLVVQETEWTEIPMGVWERQERPKVMEEWCDFLPQSHSLDYADGGKVEFEGSSTTYSRFLTPGRVPVRRLSSPDRLFAPIEKTRPEDSWEWHHLKTLIPELDMPRGPLSRLFAFQGQISPDFRKFSSNLQTRVNYPPDHPLSMDNNPEGGFYGRLAALGLLRPKSQRGVFLIDPEHPYAPV